MASLAQINIKFAADLKGFSTAMQNAQRSINKMGRKMQRVGKQMTVGISAPLVAMGYAAVKNFDLQAKAIAQVEQGLRSTGNMVGYTSEQLQKMASDLQNETLFGDEKILKDATAQLLTFTNIAGEQFARTQQAALDLATRLDGDLKSASIQLGKALNDPIANLSALSRSGIQFSEDQKKTIKALAETNHLADAQTIILNELEKQYGGSAAAAAKAGLGPFTQLKNSISDLSEEFGQIISEALRPFIEWVKKGVQWFVQLDTSTKKIIVGVAAIAAAAGPLLALAGTILPAIMSGLTLLTGPIGLIVAGLTAVGVVIYKNWEPIKQTLIDISNYFINLYNESTVFRIAVEAIGAVFKTNLAVAKFALSAIWDLIKALADGIVNRFKLAGQIIKGALTFDWQALKQGWKDYEKNSADTFGRLVSRIKDDWATMSASIADTTTTALNNVTQRVHIKLLPDNIDTTAAEQKIVTNLSGALARASVQNVPVSSSGATPIATGEVATDLPATDPVSAIQAIPFEELQARMQALKDTAQIVGQGVGDAFSSMANGLVNSLGLADKGFQGFLKGLFKTVTKLISMMLSNSMANVIAGATAAGTATGPAAPFTTPAFIAEAVAGIVAAFAAIPKFATGGVVGGSSYFGDKILARLNSSELILNQKQQRQLYNQLQPVASNVTIGLDGSFELDGQMLRLVLDRVDSYNNRVN